MTKQSETLNKLDQIIESNLKKNNIAHYRGIPCVYCDLKSEIRILFEEFGKELIGEEPEDLYPEHDAYCECEYCLHRGVKMWIWEEMHLKLKQMGGK